MDINQLNCFVSVAQTLNFSEAARRNYVSQSTVSRYVSDLEKEFGVQLFIRSHRDVVITNEGRMLLPYVMEIIDALKKAKTTIKQMHDGGKGKITISCDVTSLAFPSKCIEEFTAQYPDISIEIKPLDTADRASAIIGEEQDFCFMPRDMVPESSEISSLITHYDPLMIVSGKKLKSAADKCIRLKDMADKKLVLLSEGVSPILYMEVMDLLRTFHISPNVASTYDDFGSMQVAVASGMGLSFLPQSMAKFSATGSGNIYNIEDADTSIAYVMAWVKEISNPSAKLFYQIAKKFAVGEDNMYGL